MLCVTHSLQWLHPCQVTGPFCSCTTSKVPETPPTMSSFQKGEIGACDLLQVSTILNDYRLSKNKIMRWKRRKDICAWSYNSSLMASMYFTCFSTATSVSSCKYNRLTINCCLAPSCGNLVAVDSRCHSRTADYSWIKGTSTAPNLYTYICIYI